MRNFYCLGRWERLSSFLFIFCFIFSTSHATDSFFADNFENDIVVCTDPPIITCPPDYTGCPGDDTSASALGSATAVAGGPDCGTPVIGFYEIIFSNGPCTGEIFFKRVWYAYDPNDPSITSNCTQEITLIDNTAPVITNCPQNIIAPPTNSNCDAIVSWTAPTATDDCSTVTLTSSHISGSSFPLGSTTTVTYTATDICGNESTCSFTITVEGSCCFDPPNITCPANYSGCPSDSTLPSNTGSASASPGGSNCVQPSVAYVDNVISTGPCTGATVIQRTWTATDPENPSSQSSCIQNITLTDTSVPTLTNCPTNVIQESNDGNCVSISYTAPTASDNCGMSSVTSNYASGFCFAIGTTTVTYTATDNCGNTATCSFTVTIEDNSCNMPPILNCPGDYNSCPGTSTDPSITGNATVAPGQPNCGNPNLTYNDVVLSTGPCSGTTVIERTWTATDPDDSSLVSTCAQIITLSDNVNPTITACPNNITLQSNDGNCVTTTWAAPTATDNCGTPSLSSNYSSGFCFPIGITTVIYTATDNCGNTAACSFTVTVEDLSCMNGPTLICPADYTHCPGINNSDPKMSGLPIAIPSGPNCGTPVITFSDVVISTSSCGEEVIERTWTATDADDPSLVSTCVQTISFIDDTDPVLTPCPTNQTLSSTDGNCVNANWTSPTATDACTMVTVTSTYLSGDCFPIGTTTVTYTATDECGNTDTCSFTITVTDDSCNAPPIISCPTDFSGCPGDSTEPSNTGFATATAGSSFCDDPIVTYSDVNTNPFDCWAGQLIERTWTATDPNDNSLSSTCVQLIELNDQVDPIISCPGNQTLTSNDGNCIQAFWTTPTTSDNCSIQSINTLYNSGYCFPVGTTMVTYKVFDHCGNSAICSFTISVLDNSCSVPPIITCPVNFSGCPSESIDPINTGSATASAGSSFCENPIITYADVTTNPFDCLVGQLIERTWKATDPNDSSLFSTCTQLIELNDQVDPIISCPGNQTLTSNDGNCIQAFWVTPTTSDNCSLQSINTLYNSGYCFPVGTTLVTYKVFDHCGNSAICSFTITVLDNSCSVPPIISCPTTFEGCPLESVDPSNTGYATATPGGTNCADPIITYADEYLFPYMCAETFDIQRTWTATDPNNPNLTSTCLQLIQIRDIEIPTITCPANIVNDNPTGAAMVSVSWSNPISSDNCGIVGVTSTHIPGDMFPIGVTTVSYTVTDACGHAATCSFTVTVEEPTSLICPDDIVLQCDGSGGTVITWSQPTFDSQCNDCGTAGNVIPGFIYMGTLNGHKYYCSSDPDLWVNAQTTCVANGGHLAVINSQEENDFLTSFLVTQSAYIGLSDVQSEGNFTWVNGDPVTYTNWYANQPNNFNGAQHFVELLSSGQWNDQYGKIALEYIMEIPCTTITQTCGPVHGSSVAPGTYDICYTASDGCGNSGTCSFTITVEESISINCPNDVTLSCPAGNNGIIVNWMTPEATSCCSIGNCGPGGAINGFIYMGQYNGSNYYCSNSPSTWIDAEATCVANGGHLAIVNDQQENNFLTNFLTTQSAYIGLSDHVNEGTFTWANGDPLSYTNWYPGQPNNFNNSQHYVELLSNGQWNDQYGKVALEYIMEIPSCTTVNQTSGPYSGTLFNINTTTTITYEATDECGNTAICSFDITIVPSYCSSGGLNSKYTYIDKVQFGPIHNTSGNNGGYADFSDVCHPVSVGQNCNISLTPGFGASPYPCYWKVYCDWNQDNDFFDAGEYIAYGSGSGTINGNFTIPSNIWNGECKLRVVMKYGSYPTSPCETFAHGETEDYCITVSGAEITNLQVANREEVEGTYMEGFFDDQYTMEIPLNEESEFTFKAFPNPASEFVNVTFDQELDEGVEIGLFSLDGKRISTRIENTENTNVVLDVSQVENGIYLIKVTNGKLTETKKIVVTH